MATPPASDPRNRDELGEAFESMAAHIAVLESDGRIRAVNRAWRRFAVDNSAPGVPIAGDTGVGDNYLAVCRRAAATGEGAEAALAADGIEDVLAGRRDRFELEYACDGPAGLRWFTLVVTPLGGRRGAVVAHHDITDRKRAEEALVGHNQVLSKIVAGASSREALDEVARFVEAQLPGKACSILLRDPEKNTLYSFGGPSIPEGYSRAIDGLEIGPDVGACGTAAYLREGVHCGDIASDPRWSRFRDVALRHGLRSCSSLPIFGRDGGEPELLGTFAIYGGEPGPADPRVFEIQKSAASLAGVVIERDRAGRAIHEGEERYRRLVDMLPVAVFLQADYAIHFCNPAFARLTGLPGPEAAIGRNPLSFFAPDHHDAIRSRIRDMTTSRTPAPSRETTLVRKDGARLTVNVVATPVHDRGRTSVLVAMLDVTERKKLEEQYRQSQKMEAVGQLAGGVAHDFNNLLTVITGYAETLQEDIPEGSAHQEAITAIREAAERAAGLTAQLLAFSRKALVEPKDLDLHDVITSFGRLLRRLIGEDVRLVVDLAKSPSRVRIDPGQIEQVLLNLAVNARDAMPTGGRLTITTTDVEVSADLAADNEGHAGPHVVLDVADTGYGMTPEVLSRIFEPFFTTKSPGRGTGLGLATVYGIVRQAGGFVTVESSVGEGSTFRVYLPVAARPTAPSPSSGRLMQAPGHETILLVEDEEAVRRLVSRVLRGFGYSLIEASSGEEALRCSAAHSGPIHLLLTDVVMPDIGGRALADRMREVRPATRVLFMSGYTDDAILRHGVETAVDAVLSKPFTPSALARKLREVFDAAPPSPRPPA